ncbi:MAG TPA: hypothetical protein DCL43_02315 [Chitinophagaceae bacterium]|nr:hypothetical protein [Chitinophagaceae bacterium]HAN39641.1 hypothetical protein [Chitinophagaceae bacterium]
MNTIQFENKISKWLPFILSLIGLLVATLASAQSNTANAAVAEKQTLMSNPVAVSLIIIAGVLLLIIALMANVMLGTAKWFLDKEKQQKAATIVTTILLVFGMPMSGIAQDATADAPKVATTIAGLSEAVFYLITSVIGLELFIILMLAYFIRLFIAKDTPVVAPATEEAEAPSTLQVWWDKMNSFKPVEQEANIDLGHNYDGIRELDNRLPPWWLYGFYVTILVGVVYLYRYHVSHTAPSSKEEFELAMKQAEADKAAYLAKAANNVDENTVKLLTEASDLEKGKTTFTSMCAACHGTEGQGGVGPNLTDDYWLNGGSINDVFKTIKYGRPEKGMKSWKDDYSPVQIAQLASYIKSLKGTNPANPKEKQGELYQEGTTNPTSKDSTAKETKSIAMNP